MTSTPRELPFAGDSAALGEIIERLSSARLVALDTEFIRERTYYPELCVLQIATDDILVAVDCLADIDLDSLLAGLIEGDKTWLLHSARQDLEVLLERTGKPPVQMIDTQIAAALMGSPLQVGLQGLLADVLNVTIAKEHTRTDWSRRPLPAEALGYAIDDVRYLIAAWHELEKRLRESGRLDWCAEDCARQLALPIQPDARALLDRTKGAGSLTGKRRGAALALIEWREKLAQNRNKPRRWMLSDEALISIASSCPASTAALEEIRGLPRRLIAHRGEEIVAAVQNAAPETDDGRLAPPDKTVVNALREEVRRRADALGLQSELLATRKDLVLTAAGRTPESLLTGWRQTILGDAIERII